MLIRFETSSGRIPSVSVFQGLIEWVRGSLALALGTHDYDDFKPFSTSPGGVGGSAGNAISGTAKKSRLGYARITATAGANANTEYVRNSFFDLASTPNYACEWSFIMNAVLNTPKVFIGLTDQAAGSVLATGALASGSAQNGIGLLWNGNTKKLDIVSVVNGTAFTIKSDIGVTLDPASTPTTKIGLRVDRIRVTNTHYMYRLTPVINGDVARAGATTVDNSVTAKVPDSVEVASLQLQPTLAHTVLATTAPSLDIDWLLNVDR